jgi:2-polyprenyl-3-methyl-5-hydroxy-6-metoxy-1,4-benzoquinol methylase
VAHELSGFFEGAEMPAAGWGEALWPDPAKVLHAVGLMPGMDVIDLCSGDGWFTLQIARTARHVLAIDLDPRLLDVARARLNESGITNCSFVAGNAYDVADVAPQPVDLVFMANAFHGVPDRPRLAREVRKAIRPGAHFAIVNWHHRPSEQTMILGEPRGPRTELRLSPKQTIEAIEPSGLRLSHLVEVPPYHYGAIFGRAAS